MKTTVKTISLKILLVFATFFITLLLFPRSESRAQSTASLYFSPSTRSVGVNQTFTMTIYVNPGGQAINAVTANFTYPTDKLSVVSISGNSTNFPTVAEETYSSGTVFESRGTSGSVSTTVQVATITFRALQTGTATLTFTNDAAVTRVSDSTNILGTKTGATITIGTLPNSGIIDRFDTIFVFIVATLLIFVGTGAFMQYRHDHNQLKLIDD
jgi:hypothetical protein